MSDTITPLFHCIKWPDDTIEVIPQELTREQVLAYIARSEALPEENCFMCGCKKDGHNNYSHRYYSQRDEMIELWRKELARFPDPGAAIMDITRRMFR